MASERPRYTVSEIEQLTGISRRTIHFYVKEGVIAPPDGVAGGARYNEEHLLRLKLTRELQKSHLKLSGITEAMDRLSLEQMRSMLGKAKSSARTWDKAALERWLERRVAGIDAPEGKEKGSEPTKSSAEGAAARIHEVAVGERDLRYEMEPESADKPDVPWNQSFLDFAGSIGQGQTHHTWDRIQIAEGLEVLVRTDLVSQYRRAITELAGHVAGAAKAKEKP